MARLGRLIVAKACYCDDIFVPFKAKREVEEKHDQEPSETHLIVIHSVIISAYSDPPGIASSFPA